MGRMIKYRKKDGKYRIWSTNTDSWVTDWDTREGTIDTLKIEMFFEFDRKIKHLEESFPGGYIEYGTRKIMQRPII